MSDSPKPMFQREKDPAEEKSRRERAAIMAARALVHAMVNERGPRLCALRMRELTVCVYDLPDEAATVSNEHLGLRYVWGLAAGTAHYLRTMLRGVWKHDKDYLVKKDK